MTPAVNVCEVFASIQGESTRAGMPCFFIRLAGCNLDCNYCDTAYARRTRGRRVTVAALAQSFRASRLRLAEVTGGEPLLQPTAPALLRRLGRHGRVLLETNGSCDISAVPAEAVVIMDIKTPASGQAHAMDWENLKRLRPHDEVKFVLAGRADYDWARALVAKHRLERRCAAVLFSPVAGRLPPARLAGWILRDGLPVRLNLQWHKILWPARRRGV